MDKQRWNRIDSLLQAAFDLPQSERAAFLDRACAGDDEMRREIVSLLNAEDRAGSFLNQSPIKRGTEEVSPATGARIGAYRIVREIGRGGMGAVYLAERADQQFAQRVAIKLIKRGMDTEEIINRFRYERQILASLNHPNIARLFDGGATEDGLPYFVMEYIEGEPLPDYCDRRKLGVADRLKLFLQVCAAVQHAHNNLIIHRDLKPGNIIVTEEGGREAPKLLDFGIAKLLDSEQAGISTVTGLRPMTPEYASPEQARGASVTTASDVYSLGVVLYELLTGRRPYRLSNLTPDELARVICEQEPEKPSSAIKRATEENSAGDARQGQVEKLRRRLGGDLDNIVLMALRKEPERRYQSPAQLAEDIERHLDGETVSARPSTFGYRSGKFIRRHKAGVAAGALVVAALLAGIIATTWQARVARAAQARAENALATADAQRLRAEREQAEATAQRDRAEREQARAEAQRSRAEESQRKAKAEQSRAEQALALAQREQNRAENEKARAESEKTRAERRFKDLRTLATSFLFNFYDAIQDVPGTTQAQQLIVKKAVEHLDNLAREAAGDSSLQGELAAAYHRLGRIQSTGTESTASTGDSQSALASYRKALSLREAIAANDPANPTAQSDLATSYTTLATLQLDTGNEAGAVENARKGLEMRAAVSAANPKNAQEKMNLMIAYRSFFFIVAAAGHLKDGIDSLRQSVKTGEELIAAYPDNVQYRAQLAITLRYYGMQIWFRGDLDAAWDSYRRSQAMLEEWVAKNQGSRTAPRNLTIVETDIGELLLRMGDAAGALEKHRQLLSRHEETAAKDTGNAVARRDVANSHERIGDALAALGDTTGALIHYRRQLAISEEIASKDKNNTRFSRDFADAYVKIARQLEASGNHTEALEQASKACEIYDVMLAKEPKALYLRRVSSDGFLLLGELLVKTGKTEDGRRRALQGLVIKKELADIPDMIGLYVNEYAWPLLTSEPADLRDADEALRYARIAAERTREKDPNILNTLALAYHLTGDHARAVETAKKALALLPSTNGHKDQSVLRRDLETRLAEAQAAMRTQSRC